MVAALACRPAPVAFPVAMQRDPIFAGIAALRATETALTAALKDLDEDDAEQLRVADARPNRPRPCRSRALPSAPALRMQRRPPLMRRTRSSLHWIASTAQRPRRRSRPLRPRA